MVTAYDYPSAVHVCRAGIDILLVGDSVGMVELGYDTTQPVTVDDMLHHCKVGALSRQSLAWSCLPARPLRTLIFVQAGAAEVRPKVDIDFAPAVCGNVGKASL